LNIDMASPTDTIRALAVVIAFSVDHVLGEPPARFHPVVWIGTALSSTGAPWPGTAPRTALARGAATWIAGAVLFTGAAWLVVAAIRLMIGTSSSVGVLAQAALMGLLLKPLLAWRMLRDEVAAVESAVDSGVEAGRATLRRLVSRDTSRLSATEIRESALESLAENLNDSLVAPLFWFAIGGLPGAALYRFANTADAMWGYRGRWEWAGKWAARSDDVLSYIPARLTVVLLAIATWHWPSGLRQIARVTPSPNGGWPMGMLALALNVRLSKPGVYILNSDGDPAVAHHLWAALRTCGRGAWLAVALTAAAIFTVSRWS
jgi:adenosylcobinamide-phosphate synthase